MFLIGKYNKTYGKTSRRNFINDSFDAGDGLTNLFHGVKLPYHSRAGRLNIESPVILPILPKWTPAQQRAVR